MDKEIKCESCGSAMHYSPSTGKMKCTNCGKETEFDKGKFEQIESYDLEEWCDSKIVSSGMKDMLEIECGRCHAVTTLSEDTTSAKCPFCGSDLLVQNKQTRSSIAPCGILPFKVEEKECKDAYQKWISGKWMAPSDLKKNLDNTAPFKGVYLPYWCFEAQTSTYYRGERGEEHKRTVERDGKKVEEKETEWLRVTGKVNKDFKNILVPASDTLPKSLSNVIGNWDLENCVPYRDEYVSGFITEMYKKDYTECSKIARERMEEKIEECVRKDIGGNDQRISSKEIDFGNIKFKLLLLPLWISSYQFNDKVYQFAINGRNGKVKGEFPKSKSKMILIIVVIIVVIALLVALL